MLKGILLVSAFFGCSCFGLYKSYRLQKRRKLLQEISGVIFRIGEEIRFSGRPISELSVLSGRENSLFGALSEEDGYWKRKVLYEKWFRPEDWEILDPFFESFGKTDAEGQITSCSITCQRLSEQGKKAEEENGKKCRLYSYSGVLAGLFLVILFL